MTVSGTFDKENGNLVYKQTGKPTKTVVALADITGAPGRDACQNLSVRATSTSAAETVYTLECAD